MPSKACRIAVLVFALAWSAVAAGAAQSPSHRPRGGVASSGLLETARAWFASWLGQGGGHDVAAKERDGSHLDPNGLLTILKTLPDPLPPPTCPAT